MMVLRHIRPPLTMTTVVSHHHPHDEDDEESSPIDLSNKHVPPSEVPRNLSNRPHVSHPRNPPTARNLHGINSRLCRTLGATSEVRWRDGPQVLLRGNEDENSYGEDDDFHSSEENRKQNFIPLSRIQARYHQRHDESPLLVDESTEDQSHVSPKSDNSTTPDQVQSKRARLDCLISHIKQSKPLDSSGRNSDDNSSGEHPVSSYGGEGGASGHRPREGPPFNILGMDRFRIHASEEDEEPCNLACPKQQRPSSAAEASLFESWKNAGPLKGMPPLSPSEAAKVYGVDPETYQQHMMQLQLTSAAMMGDSGGIMKVMQGCPPWLFLGYYSQILQNFQAQEILRQYAMQSTNPTSTVIQEETSPSTPRTLGAAGYTCQSPLSPASLSEGQMGADSDCGSAGQTTPGSVNGKRAPRAMTGRHVRTGTGASPSTLQTLRLKIEERQRLKAQQLRSGLVSSQQSNSKGRNGMSNNIHNNHNANNGSLKVLKKSKK